MRGRNARKEQGELMPDALTDPISSQFTTIRKMFSGDGSRTGPGGTPGSGLPAPADQTKGNRMPTWARAATGPIGWLFGGGGHTQPANPMVGDLAVEPVEGDSLTQYLRSTNNLLGSNAQRTRAQGEGVLGLGLDVTGKGLDLFNDPINYFQKLLSGDQQSMSEAVAPEARAISSQYDAAQRAAAIGNPRSGYRSSTMANLPFEQAGKVGDLYQRLRPTAAGALANIGGSISDIGLRQQGVGTGLMGLSNQEMQTLLQSLLQRRGQNMGQDTANLNMLTGGLTQMLSALV